MSNLAYADDDAIGFRRALIRNAWSDSHIKLLVNEQATKRNIEVALESWLTKAGCQDLIVLFWSGHGFFDPEDPQKVYFACYDTDLSIPPTGYRMDRVRQALEERGARNVLVFVDACNAGKIITRGEQRPAAVVFAEQLRRDNRIPNGWIFMLSSETDRKAVEHSSWSNGAFSHCLIKALLGAADGFQGAGAKDGDITMGEVRFYLASQMPELTQRVLGVAKHPVIMTSSGSPQIWNLSINPAIYRGGSANVALPSQPQPTSDVGIRGEIE